MKFENIKKENKDEDLIEKINGTQNKEIITNEEDATNDSAVTAPRYHFFFKLVK